MRLKNIVFAIACLDAVLIAAGPAIGYADAVCFMQTAHSATTAYDWYCMPRTDGQQPVNNPEMAFMEDYDAVSTGDPDEKVIYLTFDAGYENGYTPQILDTLKAHHAPAAFFVVGHYITSSPDLVLRMAEEGHLVCNHSTRHKDMAAMTDFEAFKKEIGDIEEMYRTLTGNDMPKYFRPPAGRFSELCLQYAQQLGYTTVFWSMAYKDWEINAQPSPEAAFKTIISRTHPGAIILLHAVSKTNAQILGDVITEWENMGYTLKSLDDLPGVGDGPVY